MPYPDPIDQYSQVEEWTNELSEFVTAPEFAELALQDQSYLEAQLPLLVQLRDVLSSRVAAAKTDEPAPEVDDPDA